MLTSGNPSKFVACASFSEGLKCFACCASPPLSVALLFLFFFGCRPYRSGGKNRASGVPCHVKNTRTRSITKHETLWLKSFTNAWWQLDSLLVPSSMGNLKPHPQRGTECQSTCGRLHQMHTIEKTVNRASCTSPTPTHHIMGENQTSCGRQSRTTRAHQ